MKFAGKVYSGDRLLGHVCADSLTTIKRMASQKCNGYNQAIDKMVLHRFDDKEYNPGVTFTRFNRISPNNTVIRGQWK